MEIDMDKFTAQAIAFEQNDALYNEHFVVEIVRKVVTDENVRNAIGNALARVSQCRYREGQMRATASLSTREEAFKLREDYSSLKEKAAKIAAEIISGEIIVD